MIFNHEIKEYNLNLISLNLLLSEKIELEISNFLYENNLKLNLNSRDLNNIFKHFIINEILSQFNQNFDNILVFNPNFSLKFLQISYEEEACKAIIHKILDKSIKIFNFNVFLLSEELNVDTQLIYKFKKILQNKPETNFKKIKEYTEKNNLKNLESKIKNSLQTKLLLNK
jgi:hypothetical protein